MPADGVLDLRQFTMHEMRLEPTESSANDPALIVTGYAVHEDNVHYTANGEDYAASNLVSGTVWRWRPAAARARDDDGASQLEKLVDLADFITPATTGLSNVGNGNQAVRVDCPGGPSWDGVDYMHQSSCGPGVGGDLVSSLRNLNAVVSLKADGSGVNWILSSDPALNTTYRSFKFEHDNERFYYPHHVSQLPTGHILLMDDGLGRPGCMAGSESECYNRAIECARARARARPPSRGRVGDV